MGYEVSLSTDELGSFVVVWSVYGRDGSRAGVQGQRFDSAGQALLGEFRVNTYTPDRQRDAAVAADADGNFVIVWSSGRNSYDGPDGSDSSVQGQFFDSGGRAVGGELQINTYTTNSQGIPAVAADGSGHFIVVWSSSQQYGLYSSVWGRRYDSAGHALGGELQVGFSTTSSNSFPAVAAAAGGGFVVVWRQSYQGQGSVRGRRFDSAGGAVGGELQVSSITSSTSSPAIAMDASGGFVVVWSSSGGGSFIQGRRFGSDGVALGDEFQVNSVTTYSQFDPAVATDVSGNFVVVWKSYDYFIDYQYVHGRRFDSASDPLGAEFQVNPGLDRRPYHPAVATDPAGNFTVVWLGLTPYGSYRRVLAQRYCPDPDADGVCDVDDNCPVDANADQSDLDVDGIGDACDLCQGDNSTGDTDGDGVCDDNDFCVGDDSTGDPDHDLICSDLDPCPEDSSADCVFTDDFESGDVAAWGNSP